MKKKKIELSEKHEEVKALCCIDMESRISIIEILDSEKVKPDKYSYIAELYREDCSLNEGLDAPEDLGPGLYVAQIKIVSEECGNPMDGIEYDVFLDYANFHKIETTLPVDSVWVNVADANTTTTNRE